MSTQTESGHPQTIPLVAKPDSTSQALGLVLSDWDAYKRFLGYTFLFLSLLAGFAWLVLVLVIWWFELKPKEIEVSQSPRVVLQQVTDQGREYRVLVSSAASPTPWQDTGIEIEDGDRVEIQAEGRVNINLFGLVQHVELRHRIEARIDSALGAGSSADEPSRLPERHYTERDRLALGVKRGWTGPDGYGRRPDGSVDSMGIIDAAYRGRTDHKLFRSLPFGMLIGAVHDGRLKDPPAAQRDRPAPAAERPLRTGLSPFPVGSSTVLEWTGEPGTLWFAVNDVWDDEDKDFPDKFYVDNLGFFLVRVVIDR